MRSLLLLLAFFLSALAYSQYEPVMVNLKTGKKEVTSSIEILPRIFGYDSSGYFALTKRGSRFGIAHYNNRMQRVNENDIDLNVNLKQRRIVKMVHFHDSIYMFFTLEGIKSKTLYVQTVFKDSLEQKEPPRELLQVNAARGWKPDFGVVLSRDETRMLIYSRIIIHGQRQGLLEMIVCDKGLREQWRNSFRFGFERAPIHMEEFVVDEFGNVYMLDHLYTPPIPNITGRINTYMVLAVTEQGEKLSTYRIEYEGHFLKNGKIEPAGREFVICSGFLSNLDLDGSVTGTFYFRINTRLGILQNQRKFEIPKEDFFSGECFGLHTDHLIWKKQGYCFLVGEQIFRESHNHYQNLFICLFEPDGALRWQRAIHKQQSKEVGSGIKENYRGVYSDLPETYWDPLATDEENINAEPAFNLDRYRSVKSLQRKNLEDQLWIFSSYALIAPLDEGWIAVAFNDRLKNLDPATGKNKVFDSGKKSYMKLVRAGPSGFIEEQVAYKRDRRKIPTPMPFFSYDTKQSRIVFPAGRKNNTYYMMELELQ